MKINDKRAALRKMHSDFVAYGAIIYGGGKDNKNDGCYRDGYRDFMEYMVDGFPSLLDELDKAEARVCDLEDRLSISPDGKDKIDELESEIGAVRSREEAARTQVAELKSYIDDLERRINTPIDINVQSSSGWSVCIGERAMFYDGIASTSFSQNGRVGTIEECRIDNNGERWFGVLWDDKTNVSDDGHSFVKEHCLCEIDPVWYTMYVMMRSINTLEEKINSVLSK